MSAEERFDRIDNEITAVNRKLHDIGDRVASIESGQSNIDRRLTKVEVTQEAMRDDIKALAEGHAATQAAIVRSTDRVIAYIDERISPIEQAVRHLSR